MVFVKYWYEKYYLSVYKRALQELIYWIHFFLGGDVFIHAKCNTPSKLFELAQVVMKNMPPNSVESFEDVYSFVYKNGRDLSGFIDGTVTDL